MEINFKEQMSEGYAHGERHQNNRERGPRKQPRSDDPFCFSWAKRGACHRGESCKYRHEKCDGSAASIDLGYPDQTVKGRQPNFYDDVIPLQQSEFITRKQLGALSGRNVEGKKHYNALRLGTPFYLTGAVGTSNNLVNYICIKEGHNIPLPESPQDGLVIYRHASHKSKDEIQRDVHLLMEKDRRQKSIPIFWEPCSQPVRKGEKGVIYVGHWNFLKAEVYKFKYKNIDRCGELHFEFERYDRRFDRIIALAHGKTSFEIGNLSFDDINDSYDEAANIFVNRGDEEPHDPNNVVEQEPHLVTSAPYAQAPVMCRDKSNSVTPEVGRANTSRVKRERGEATIPTNGQEMMNIETNERHQVAPSSSRVKLERREPTVRERGEATIPNNEQEMVNRKTNERHQVVPSSPRVKRERREPAVHVPNNDQEMIKTENNEPHQVVINLEDTSDEEEDGANPTNNDKFFKIILMDHDNNHNDRFVRVNTANPTFQDIHKSIDDQLSNVLEGDINFCVTSLGILSPVQEKWPVNNFIAGNGGDGSIANPYEITIKLIQN
eukprot:CAMPEP_0198141480 /NCGR_PEP_ID=MMETSP1443-20131203/4486_1 /TAXON_ID=186043 /ORGANISM="Entomoneis sp., Strain CCMP2396" /LENGTH=550 /DNA_ID=CAMNT_0043804245 /DNA_START=53 /DNA_END=1705 /DNA_ORIENTATION=-